MALETRHKVDRATRRLLGAPDDLRGEVPDQGKPRSLEEAGAEHRKLYAEYIRDFAHAYELADEWWTAIIDAFIDEGYSEAQAKEMAFDQRFSGPASSPQVVWFFRTYWHAFDEVNRGLPAKDRIPPQICMLGWLVEEDRNEYVRLVTCMLYWPIGLDDSGNWT